MIFLCWCNVLTQVNMMLVMLLWVYIHTGQAWKICLIWWKWKIARCEYTLRVTSQFTWVHYTNTEKSWFTIIITYRYKMIEIWQLRLHTVHYPAKFCNTPYTVIIIIIIIICLVNHIAVETELHDYKWMITRYRYPYPAHRANCRVTRVLPINRLTKLYSIV
jgi:hypothetical protein